MKLKLFPFRILTKRCECRQKHTNQPTSSQVKSSWEQNGLTSVVKLSEIVWKISINKEIMHSSSSQSDLIPYILPLSCPNGNVCIIETHKLALESLLLLPLDGEKQTKNILFKRINNLLNLCSRFGATGEKWACKFHFTLWRSATVWTFWFGLERCAVKVNANVNLECLETWNWKNNNNWNSVFRGFIWIKWFCSTFWRVFGWDLWLSF